MELTGISVDYLVRLEQGCSEHPTASTVAALVRTLQLFSAAGLSTPNDSTEELVVAVKTTTGAVNLNRLHEIGLPVDDQQAIVRERP